MSDFNDSTTGDSDEFYSFFVFLFAAVCICYCCRVEEPADDPANDRIIGYFPNPAAATENLEQRRKRIEDQLILKQVVAPEEPEDEEDGKISASSHAASSRRSERPMMSRIVKSERTFASYAMAMKHMTRSSSSRKAIKFASLDNRTQSLPIGGLEEDGDEEKGEEDDEEKQEKKEDTADNHGHDHNHSHDSTAPAPIKHRRKSDIVARTLARTLSKTQDYESPTTCDICLLDYEVGEEVAWSNNEGCIHAFHKECITDWLLRNPKCPLCRRDYVEDT